MKTYIEVKKSENEVICLEAPTDEKAFEMSCVLDIVNTELKLGLALNLHIEVPKNEKEAKRIAEKWNKLLNNE